MIRRVAALVIASIAATQPLLACAPAPHAGERIDIVEESAVIQWDPATKTQQFIRRATFKGTAKDFGFLVPTPTTPALEEASDDIFAQLETKTARKVVEKTTKKLDWTPLVMLLLGVRQKGETSMAPAGARAPVEVLSIQKIAGYEAAVLDATDAKALDEWLSKNGYATTPDLAEWLDAYIKQGWKITAFKIDKSQGDAARTSAVKMTFQTERPFFPYRELKTERPYDSARALTIFFQGPERVSGVIGEKKEHWPGVMTWSDTKLTKFVDTSNIRPGFDDLFFVRDNDQSAYELPPIVNETVDRTHLPADVLAVAAVLLLLIIRRIRG